MGKRSIITFIFLALIFGASIIYIPKWQLRDRGIENPKAEKTAELSKQAQVTERFTRAIHQLAASYTNGKKRLEIRVGGIYALEGIARESAEYYWPVMEILTAYVRENASWQERIQEAILCTRFIQNFLQTSRRY
jgi:hypothetical protein